MNHLFKRSLSMIMAVLMVLAMIPANPVHVHAEEAAPVTEEVLKMSLYSNGKSSETVDGIVTYYDTLADMTLGVQNTSASDQQWQITITLYKATDSKNPILKETQIFKNTVSAGKSSTALLTSSHKNSLLGYVKNSNEQYVLRIKVYDNANGNNVVADKNYRFNYTNQSVVLSVVNAETALNLVGNQPCQFTLGIRNKGTDKKLVVTGTVASDNLEEVHSFDVISGKLNNGYATVDLGEDKLTACAEAGTYTIKITAKNESGVVVAEEEFVLTRTITPAEPSLSGSGTEAEPYEIGTVAELELFRDSVNAGETKYNAPGVVVALTDDIDMAGATWERGIGDGINATFDGIFDGKSFTIKNLNLAPKADDPSADQPWYCGGLFGYTYGAAVIKDVVLENITVKPVVESDKQHFNVGVLVGYANNKGGKLTVSTVTVKNVTIDAPNAYGVGAIVGYSYRSMGTIENCTVDGANITGYSFVGGITGYSYENAVITGCTVNNAIITATSKGAGGIAGLAGGNNNISNNTVTDTTVTASANWGYVVGELGASNAQVSNNTAKAPQIGGDYATGEAYAAKIGNKYYTSLDAAVEAAQAGETIALISDVELTESLVIPANKTITLDLAGKTISQTKECTASYEMINNKGNLTITGNGKISFTDTSTGDPNFGWGSYTIRNEGTLVVENGTIEHLGAQAFATHMICAIFQYSGSTTIKGGTISTPNYRSVRLWKGDMTITGGTFDGQLWVQAVDNSSKLTINGGEFAPNGRDGSSVFVTNATYDVALAVTGGNFATKIGASNATKLAGAVKGGTFTKAAAEGTNAALLGEGMQFSQNADGNYGVVVDPAYGKVAKIGDAYFKSVADALAAAEDGDIITLISGDTVISMAGSVVGNKTVTITGTATVDWTKGNLFIGRGGEGDGKVIFDDANITSYAQKTVASTGIHVSGSKGSDANTNNGVLVIKNSNIELDYLINRNEVTVESGTLTVYGGCYTHGRDASESSDGTAKTATMTIEAGATVNVINENGMGVGGESNGVMTVKGTYKANVLNISAIGEVKVEDGVLDVAGNVTNNGALTIKDSNLTDATITGTGTTYFYGNVEFNGTNSVTTTVNGSNFDMVVKKGATLLISRFVLGYNRNITVYGEIEDAHNFDPTGKTPSLKFNSTSGVSVGGTGTGNLIVKDAYVELGNSSWKNAYGTYTWNFENSYVSATSFTNATSKGSESATWNVTFDDSVLAAKNYIKNGVGTTYNFINGSVATTGSLRIDGVLNIDETSSVTTTSQQNNKVGAVDEHGGINGTVNVKGNLTIGSNAKTQLEVLGGELNVEGNGKVALGNNTMTLDENSKLTIDATGMNAGEYSGIEGAVTNNGTIEVKHNDDLEAKIENGKIVLAKKPVASVTAADGTVTGYATVQEAINAAKTGETVVIMPGEYGAINISNKNITISGTVGENGELLTTIKGGNPAITAHGFNGTIKDLKIVDAWKVMYAEPAGNVTVDNVYVTGATYGFHLVAYVKNLTWTIQNSYMDLSWANSFGVYGDGDAEIIIEGNRFESTAPYYPESGANVVNTFLPNVTVKDNIFGKNAKILIRDTITDTSDVNIATNYYAGGVENAFADGSHADVEITDYYAELNADGTINKETRVELPRGNNFNGYTSTDAIWGEVWGNAKVSFVIKVLDANGNVMGTSSLKNIGGIIDGDVTVSWNLKLDAASNTDEYWTMSWTTAPTIDNMPAKVELWVDGVKVGGGNVQLNGPDDLNKIVAAAADSEGKILSFHTTLTAAIEAASKARTTGNVVCVLRNVTENIAAIENVTLVTNVAGGVTVTSTYNDYVDFNNATVKSGVTLDFPLVYAENSVNTVEGTLKAGTLYNARNAKLIVQNGGKIVTTGMIVNRYHTDADAGIYVYGDGKTTTVEVSCADTIGTYSGTFYTEDAVVEGNMLWIDYWKNGSGEGDSYAQSTPVFENSVVKIAKELRLYKDATLTLNNTAVTAGTVQVRENATPVVSTTDSSITAGKVENLSGCTLDAILGENGEITFQQVVAKIGNNKYYSLQDAFKAATSGCTIEILADVTISEKWDCRYTGSKFTVPVTINGNRHTIKFTGTVNDNNWNTIFRFEENATVNNLTIDISEATGAQRVISAKKSLTVDGLTINGSARYGVIFGEGASATDLAATEIVIKNSTLTGTRRAISDNEGGKDVKSVVITDNTLNANVYVSASESIVFNNNTAAGEVDLRSNSADNDLSVVAQGNTLAAGAKNYIYAKTIEAQAEFTTKNPPVKVSTKNELDTALAAAKDGDIIVLTADIDYGTTQLAITKTITLDLGGKTLTTGNAYGGISVKNNATIKNGTIVHASNTAAIKVWNATAFEDLVIDVQGKGDANKTIGGIVLQSGSTTRVGSIKNVTIKGAALTNGIETYNCGDAAENVIGSLENVNIDANGTAMLISAPVGTATNCTFDGGVNGVELWIKGNYSASLTLVNSKVEGGVYAHDEFNSNPGVVNSGTLSLTVDEATTGASAKDVTLTLARAENVGGVVKEVKDDAQAKVNDTYYATLAEAMAAAKAGDTITLLKDVELAATLTIAKSITIDGNGKTITQAEACQNTHALLYFDGTDVLDITVKNVTFDGIKGGAVIRTLGANTTIDNVVFQNCEHTQVQGLVRLTQGKAVVKNSKFLNNNCTMGISFNYDTNGLDGDTLLVENCVFEDNTANATALVYYVKGAGCKIKNNKFTENKVNCNGNGAVIYLGFQDNCTITGNLFKDNVVTDSSTSTRVAGAIFAGYQATITGNAFAGNTASNANGDTLGQICISTYYDDGLVNLSENYWNNGAPAYGKDYTIQHQTGAGGYNLSSYYTAYELNANGELVLSGKNEMTFTAKIGTKKYETIADAFAAAQDGDTITLVADIALSETIKNTKKITLDLNGKTITGTDNNTSGNFYLIDNRSELTVTGNGTITLVAKNDRDWNASSVIIANNPGGKLVVENGTFEHLGGTDMAYAIDNLTNGKGTYAETVIKGGTIKSTYRAIRQFLNGVEAQNILTVNGGTIEGTNKSIWMQDPSTNANSGTLTVDGGATLKGDVYLYVTPGSTEWPVTVSIASAALYGQSTVSYANVPAGYEVKTAGGYWGVDKVDESDPSVAAVKGVYFTALQEAISAAQSGDTVTLLADVELTETLTIPKGKSVTLDLNGKTISYSSDTAGEDMITNKGNLTITDNSDDQNGIITYCNTDTTASNVTVSTISCEPGSTLEVKSGTVKNDSANNALRGIYAYAIDILTNGSLGDVTVTISGGEVISAHYMAIRQFNNGDACKNTLVITGGKIYGATRGINIQLKNDAAYTTITGGTIEGGDYALCFFPENATHMTVTGGEFKGTIYSGTDGVISGGTFDAEPYETYIAEGYTLKSYTDGEGNTVYGVEPVYAVTISIPDGATIVVKDSKGVEAVAETDGTYKLVAGKYNYTVSKSGYNTKRGSFTVNDADMSFSVSLSVYIPYVPSGSGYHVTVEESENGGVSITPASATAGQIVTITVDPDKGYVLETLTVLDQNDKAIQLTYKGNGKYTFKMPASKVTVYATFMEDNTMLHDFTDVFASDYYYDAVLWAVENGITNGTSATTFSPNAVCTRAQVVTFLWHVFA